MSRPASHDDLDDYVRTTNVATFHLSEFAGDPDATTAYADFIRALKKVGGVVKTEHGQTEVKRKRTTAELDSQLESAQRSWDSTDKRYVEVQAAFEASDLSTLKSDWRDYEASSLRSHAKAEGYEIFALIDQDAEVRATARSVTNG